MVQSLQNWTPLGNLPVERAKDAACFLQWCGVSLVSSYAVCFLQRGGVSLASSAIIYNIVKVKVDTRLTRWHVDLLTFSKKNPSRAIARCTYIHRWDAVQQKAPRIRLCCSSSSKAKGAFWSCVAWGWRIYNIVESESDPLTRRPVDLFEKEPLKGK